MRPVRARPDQAAFSLLEMMVVLAILLILASYAVPAYREWLQRAHRQSVVVALYAGLAQAEAIALKNRNGEGSREGNGGDNGHHGSQLSPGDQRLARDLPQAPGYRITLQRADSSGYLLEARPLPQGIQAGDACGVFTLNALGEQKNQTLTGHAIPAGTVCWGQMHTAR